MASRDLFSEWTLRQLEDYIVENGGSVGAARSRDELITEAVRLANQASQKTQSKGPTSFYPSTAPSSGEWYQEQSPYQGASAYPGGLPPQGGGGWMMGPPSAQRMGPPPSAGGPAPSAGLDMTAPPVPAPMPAAGGGTKRALIVGINYRGSSAQLNGCINDAKCMEYLLRTKFGFRPENMLLMTDDQSDPMRLPTRRNMYLGFQWLMTNVRPGDSLVFHYSGHGSQQPDYSGEEPDGKNETLCPLDFRQAGEIVDNELNRLLINPVPTGAKLHAIIDACHSGSVMDLPYSARPFNGQVQWRSEYNWTPRAFKGTAGGFAVQIGAALDSQTAADTTKLSGYTSTGAATYAFIQAIEQRGTHMTYGDLVLAMDWTLHHALGGGGGGGGGGGLPDLGGLMAGGGLGGMLGGMLLGGNTASYQRQQPQLSSVWTFDLGYKFSF